MTLNELPARFVRALAIFDYLFQLGFPSDDIKFGVHVDAVHNCSALFVTLRAPDNFDRILYAASTGKAEDGDAQFIVDVVSPLWNFATPEAKSALVNSSGVDRVRFVSTLVMKKLYPIRKSA